MINVILTNRENEIACVAEFENNTSLTKEEVRRCLLDAIEENNWYEDQSTINAIDILKETVIACRKDALTTIGLVNNCEEASKIVNRNLFKQSEETDDATLYLNRGVFETGSDDDIYCCEGSEEIGEQY